MRQSSLPRSAADIAGQGPSEKARFAAATDAYAPSLRFAMRSRPSAAVKRSIVVVRPNGAPLYTFVNPVDDALMGITHVLRGEDLLSSTARHHLATTSVATPSLTSENGIG